MEARDLTHAEAAEGFRSLAAQLGPRADVIVSLDASPRHANPSFLRASIYPRGVGTDRAASVYADTWAELLAKASQVCAEQSDAHAAKTIREMALRIISITADEGVCSELSLCRSFSMAEVRTYGERACEEASRIAGNGPFSILRAASESEAA